MNKPETKPAICPECRGKHYRLNNTRGQVEAAVCSCFECGDCGGRGFVFEEDENGISSIRECTCAEMQKRLKLLNEAAIPGKFASAQFETFISQPGSVSLALRKTQDFVKDFGKGGQGLLFMGPPGVGKTHLTVAVIKALILEQGVRSKFVDFFQLLSDIRHGYSQDLSEQAIINPYVEAPVLVIDELAKGRNTEWELTMLDQIISSRYNAADKVTLFTTNYLNETSNSGGSPGAGNLVDTQKSRKSWGGEENLQEKVGNRIYSRLVEMCQFIILEGEDYRMHMPVQPRSRKK